MEEKLNNNEEQINQDNIVSAENVIENQEVIAVNNNINEQPMNIESTQNVQLDETNVISGIEEISEEEQKKDYENNRPLEEVLQPIVKDEITDNIDPIVNKKSKTNVIIIAIVVIIVIILLIFLGYKFLFIK